MARIRSKLVLSSGGVATSVAFDLPAHEAGDLILINVTQDGGTGILSLTGVTGWSEIGTQAAVRGQRTATFRKIATSSSETSPTVSSTFSEDIVVSVLVIAGVTASPIHNTWTADADNAITSPSGSTTVDGCLLIYVYGWDHTGYMSVDPADLMVSTKMQAGVCQVVGYRPMPSAGAIPQVTGRYDLSGEGGICRVIAVQSSNAAELPPRISQSYQLISRYGRWAPIHESITWTPISGIAGTIDGMTVNSTAPIENLTQQTVDQWGYYYSLNWNVAVTDQWVGAYHAISGTDFTGKLFSVHWAWTFGTNAIGAKGWVLWFADASNNWVAITLGRKVNLPFNKAQTFVFDVTTAEVLDSSGAINWAAVNKIGYLYHRTDANINSRFISLMHAVLYDQVIGVGGHGDSPLSFATFDQAFTESGRTEIFTKQGNGQVFGRVPIQIGDGSTFTHFKAFGQSFEYPAAYQRQSQYQWQVGELAVDVDIFASASDTIDFASAITRAATKQTLSIKAASSLSATYDFAGASLIGWQGAGKTGVVFNNATFASGYTLTGGELIGCTITRCLAPVAVETSDPSKIVDCSFRSRGSGHAIEITTPGTYAFVGNTFVGYGADGTSDAAIYNNSGGLVTLNVSGGGSTPTVRNGAGASTVVNAGATLTLTGLVAGSDIVILDAGTTTERVNVDANPGTTYAFGYTALGNVDVCVYKAGYVPLSVRGYALTSNDAALPITQVADRNYSNPP